MLRVSWKNIIIILIIINNFFQSNAGIRSYQKKKTFNVLSIEKKKKETIRLVWEPGFRLKEIRYDIQPIVLNTNFTSTLEISEVGLV